MFLMSEYTDIVKLMPAFYQHQNSTLFEYEGSQYPNPPHNASAPNQDS